MRVAKVRQMVGLAAAAEARLLGLDEVAHVHVRAQLRAGAQVREGPDLGVLADGGLGDHAVRKDVRARAHHGVDENRTVVDARPGADARAAAQNHVATNLGVGFDGHPRLDKDPIGRAEGGVLHVSAHQALDENAFPPPPTVRGR
jgi:hypothetical protein